MGSFSIFHLLMLVLFLLPFAAWIAIARNYKKQDMSFFNRHLLCDYFGISTPQASNDINQYKALAPDNMYYSQGTRQYIAGPDFMPLWPSEDEDD